MANLDLDQLVEDILAAKAAAQAAALAHDARMDAKNAARDGGTCNMDSMFLSVGSESSIKRSSPKLKAALAAANNGCECSHKDYGWRKGFRLGGCWGQGDRNVAGVTAGVKYLQDRGWPVSYWAQMD